MAESNAADEHQGSNDPNLNVAPTAPDPEFNEVAKVLQPELRDAGAAPRITRQILSLTRHFSGPMPPPEVLEGYEKVVPGAAKLIVQMAVNEQKHRHAMDGRETIYPFVGLFAGFILACTCIGGAVYLALHGSTGIAAVLLSVPMVGVIGWFINSRLRPERSEMQTPATKP